ncbi:MAG: hypothetical protein ACXACD_17945 [Candidatus Thorarchaeota archaeon]|jgi:hypothetical protein
MTTKEKSSIGKIGAGVLSSPEILSLIDSIVDRTIYLFLTDISREDLIAMWESHQEEKKERIEGGERQQKSRIKGRLR